MSFNEFRASYFCRLDGSTFCGLRFSINGPTFFEKSKNQKPKGSVYLKVEHFYLYYFKYLFDLLNIINCFFNNIFFK